MTTHERAMTAVLLHGSSSTAVERTHTIDRAGNAVRVSSPDGQVMVRAVAGLGASGTLGVVFERDAQGSDAQVQWDDAADTFKLITGTSTAAPLTMAALTATTVTASSTITATGEVAANGGIRIGGTVFVDASRNVTAGTVSGSTGTFTGALQWGAAAALSQGGTTRISAAGAGTLASLSTSGSVTFGTTSGSLVQGATTRVDASGNATFVAVGGTTGTFSGALQWGAAAALSQGGTTRVDASGNATFAAVGGTTGTFSGAVSIGGALTQGGNSRIGASGVFSAAVGSAAGPGYAFSTYTQTGLFAAASKLGFAVGGVEMGAFDAAGLDVTGSCDITGSATIDGTTFVVDAANNRVGIGVAAPTVQLDVLGASAGAVRIRSASSASSAALGLFHGSTEKWAAYAPASSDELRLYSGAAAADRMTLTSGGVLIITSIRLGSAIGPLVQSGSGTPEAAVTAPVGSWYVDTAGGTGTTLYIKESGTGNTGWVAK